jgi:hypothetical protein
MTRSMVQTSRSRHDGQKRKTFDSPASESNSPITFSLKLPHLRQDNVIRRNRLSAAVIGVDIPSAAL